MSQLALLIIGVLVIASISAMIISAFVLNDLSIMAWQIKQNKHHDGYIDCIEDHINDMVSTGKWMVFGSLGLALVAAILFFIVW